MFARLVLDFGVSPEYALDRMEFYEIAALTQYSFHRHKEAWERARMMAYVTAQCQSKKKLKLTDICQFTWDEKSETGLSGNGMTQEEFDSTFAQMERMIAEGLI